MRDNIFRTVGASAVLIGLVVAVVAQVGPGEPLAMEVEAPATTTAGDGTVASSEQAQSTPTQAFQYRIGLLSGVSTDNYWRYLGAEQTVWNAYVLGPSKPTLYAIDQETSGLVPEAISRSAEPRWNASGWWVDIEFRPDLVWSNGSQVTAHDLQFTFDTVRRLSLGGGWLGAFPEGVAQVTATSATTARIAFTERPTLDVWPYGIGLAPILPQQFWGSQISSLETASDLYDLSGAGDLSSGPITLVEVGDDEISALLNSSTEAVELTYTVFPNEADAVSAMAKGEIDTILSPSGLSPASVAAISELDQIAIETSPANGIRYLGFNLERQPMKTPAFRNALALLTDLPSLVGQLAPGAVPAQSMIPNANTAWFDEDRAKAIAGAKPGSPEQRLQAAVELLGKAGYTWSIEPAITAGESQPGSGLRINGQPPAPLTILTSGDEHDPTRPELAATVEVSLELLGFDVRPVVTDFNTVVDLAFTASDDGERHYDMYLLGWTLGNPALPDYYEPLFGSDGSANSSNYASTIFDAALGDYLRSTSLDEAKEALWEMEEVLATDKPYLVFYHPVISEAYLSDRVAFGISGALGGIQARLGGLEDLIPIDESDG